MKLFRITLILVICILAGPAFPQSSKLYRWVDEDGIVHFGDSVPPEYSKLEQQVINEHGITVDIIRGKKTAEELADEAQVQQLRKKRELDRRRDQALLATYLTIEEIQMHRDRRVELFQAQARVTELYLTNLRRRMEMLLKEANEFKPYNTEQKAPIIGTELAQDIKTTEATIARHEENLDKFASDEQAIVARFDGDIYRFRQLKGLD